MTPRVLLQRRPRVSHAPRYTDPPSTRHHTARFCWLLPLVRRDMCRTLACPMCIDCVSVRLRVTHYKGDVRAQVEPHILQNCSFERLPQNIKQVRQLVVQLPTRHRHAARCTLHAAPPPPHTHIHTHTHTHHVWPTSVSSCALLTHC